MSREEQIRDDIERRVKTQLPTFLGVRDTATRAVAETAEEIGLELSDVDVRSLALAVVDAIHKGAELKGVEFAYDLVDRHVNSTYRGLIAPATAKASVDPEHAAVLNLHQQYVAGMREIRRQIGDRLVYLFDKWRCDRTPALEVPPVVPIAAPAGAAEARDRAQARAAA